MSTPGLECGFVSKCANCYKLFFNVSTPVNERERERSEQGQTEKRKMRWPLTDVTMQGLNKVKCMHEKYTALKQSQCYDI